MFPREFRAFALPFLIFTIFPCCLFSQEEPPASRVDPTLISPTTTPPVATPSNPSPSSASVPPAPPVLTMITQGVSAPSPTANSSYTEPKTPVKLFNAELLGMTPEERIKIATDIATSLRLIASKRPDLPNNLATRVVAFAFNLDPDNREATIANLQFQKGVHPENVTADPVTAAKELRAKALELKSKPDENSKVFRILAMDLAVEIDPSNEDLLYGYEMNRKAGEKADWSEVLPAPLIQNPPADSTGTNRVSMVALLSPEIESQFRFQGIRMVATMQTGNNAKTTRLMMLGPITPETLATFQETERIVKTMSNRYPADADIVLNFTQNYRTQYGTSSSVTLALLLLSLTGEANIDSEVTVTGILHEDGSIGAGGTIDTRALGLAHTLSKRSVLAADYESELEDMVVFKRGYILWNSQIFFAKNLEEAKKFAAVGIDPQLTKAMASFAEAQNLWKQNHPTPATGFQTLPGMINNPSSPGRPYSPGKPYTPTPYNPYPTNNPRPNTPSTTVNSNTPAANSDAVRLKLEETIAAAPNHASAVILLRSINGTLPKTASLRGSINEIAAIVSPLFTQPVFFRNNQAGFNEYLKTYVGNATTKIAALDTLVDPRAKNLQVEISNLVRDWSQAIKDGGAEAGNPQINQFSEKIKAAIQKARTDFQVPAPSSSGI